VTFRELRDAAAEGDVERLNVPLEGGVHVDDADSHGLAALHDAAECGHDDIIDVLISHGANTDIRDNDGYTPLHYAALDVNDSSVGLLISHGVNLNPNLSVGIYTSTFGGRERKGVYVKTIDIS